MHYHVLTLFPEMIEQGMGTSIMGRAMEQGLIRLTATNIRDFSTNKHRKVDDYPYSGGGGMLMNAQPVYDAYMSVAEGLDYKPFTIYMSPQGKVFNQGIAIDLANYEHIVLLCGHYEGIDQRVIDAFGDEEISIGDYVLTGGELPAMVMIDAISRMVPGVLKNEDSGVTESFQENLLEYPQYTRPEIWEGKKVPDILLSGDHARIDKWRLEKSEERTKARRPDLYEKYDLPGRALEYLLKDKMLHMDMIEDIRRGKADILAVREDGVLTKDRSGGVYRITAKTKDAGERLLSSTDPTGAVYVCHQKFVLTSILERFGLKNFNECYQVIYPKKKAPDLPEPDGAVEIRELDETYAANCALQMQQEQRAKESDQKMGQNEKKAVPEEDEKNIAKSRENIRKRDEMFWIALFSRISWMLGAVAGGVIGQSIPVELTGIDFCMTALFVTIFVDQWRSAKSHIPALLGLGCGVVLLLLVGPDYFLLPTLILVSGILLLIRGTMNSAVGAASGEEAVEHE